MTPVPLYTQAERRTQLKRLQQIYPIQENTSGWEDFQQYFEYLLPVEMILGMRPRHIHRFASITHNGNFYYIYADYDNRCDAKQRATINLLNDIYQETPVAIVDLDKWRFWYPFGKWVKHGLGHTFAIDFIEGPPHG